MSEIKITFSSLKLFIIATAISILILGCSKKDDLEKNVKPVKKDKLVEILKIVPETVNETIKLTGNIEPESSAKIFSSIEGKITKINFSESDLVKHGDILAIISSNLREDIITAAKLKLDKSQIELKSNPNDQNLIKLNNEARENYEFALQQYKELSVISPMEGIISRKFINEGDMVSVKTSLFEIASAGKFKVNLSVPENEIGKFKIGMKSDLRIDACPDENFNGTVSRIYPNIDTITRTGIIEIFIYDPCKVIKSGMFVRASFIVKKHNNVLSIPKSSVVLKSGKKTIFVTDDTKEVKAREIETGFENGHIVIVTKGLKAGDMIIVAGQETLNDGDKIFIKTDKKGK